MSVKKTPSFVFVLATLAFLALPLLAEDKSSEAMETVAAARTTLSNFLSDPDMKWIRAHLNSAQGVLIIPVEGKGGFIFGGSGGVGVLLVRDEKGSWSSPAFYRLGSFSVGLQAGGQKSEVLLFVQSQKGVDSFLSSSFKLGADASVAAGPVGQGAQAATADILAFSRSKGAYAGASLEGTVVNPADDLNEALYKKRCTPVEILVRQTVKSKSTEGLQADLNQATRGKK